MKQNTQQSGIKSQHRAKIIAIIQANPNVESLWLFGSRARGDHKINSDIDLVISGKKLNFTELAKLIDKLERTTIPYKIDLLIKEKITNPELIERIEQEAIRWL